MNGFEDSFRVRKMGRKKGRTWWSISFTGGENFFYVKPVKYFANYLKKLSLQKEKRFRKKKSRYCSYFYTSIMPTNSKLNTKSMEHQSTILRSPGYTHSTHTKATATATPHTNTLLPQRQKLMIYVCGVMHSPNYLFLKSYCFTEN